MIEPLPTAFTCVRTHARVHTHTCARAHAHTRRGTLFKCVCLFALCRPQADTHSAVTGKREWRAIATK